MRSAILRIRDESMIKRFYIYIDEPDRMYVLHTCKYDIFHDSETDQILSTPSL